MGFACDCSDRSATDETQCQVTTFVVARKPHECCECFGQVEPGQLYRRDFLVSDGEPMVFFTCLPCDRIRQDYCSGGYYFGMLADQIRDCMGWDYRDKPEDIELDDEED